jgi:hypothetical protein
MKGKFVLCFVILLVFSSFSSYAQSTNNDQRIVGTWMYTGTDDGVTYTTTIVFNANGSGSTTETYRGETSIVTFTYGFSVDGELISDNGPRGKIYFSPDGRTLFIGNRTPYRKR